jgi:hypothetical protein
MSQNRAVSAYPKGWMISSSPALPRSGAFPASRLPITDMAEPQMSSLARDPVRCEGPRASSSRFSSDGSCGLALTR